jgi:NAD(P)-dependent dehydrogenase (short-subunit alcohol dehydrogenase family)
MKSLKRMVFKCFRLHPTSPTPNHSNTRRPPEKIVSARFTSWSITPEALMRRMDRQINWPDSDWIDDVNLKMIGMLRATQAFLPLMPRDGTGRIVNISGTASTVVWATALTHGLNNAAMNQVTSYLANDLAGERITVNAVVPGLVGTEGREIWAENMAKQQGKTKDEFLADFCRRMGIISGRWAKMEEVASLVVFLASDHGQYMNGSRFVIDGGMSANPRPA